MFARDTLERLIREGQLTAAEIAEASSWPLKNVQAAITQGGYAIGPDGIPTKRGGVVAADAAPTAVPTAATAPPTSQPEPAVDPDNLEVRVQQACSHDGLISWAKHHPTAGIRAKGDQLEKLAAGLVHSRRESEEADRAREQREQERRQALADVEELKRKLREAQDRARGRRVGRTPSAAQTSRPSAARVRAWAVTHGHTVGRTGKIPDLVLDAYELAQQELTP